MTDISTGGTKSSPANKKQSSYNAAVVLFVLAFVLVGGLGFYVGRATAPQTSAPAAQAAEAVTEEGVEQGESEAGAAESSEYAPSQTSEEALALLRSIPRRDAGDPRAIGDVNAPVVMSEFADFSCPMCTRHATDVHPELMKLVDEGLLRIEFHDMVIFSDYGSNIAAAGGVAAAEQGKFWEYYNVAFANAGAGAHPTYTVESVTELAKEAGVPDLDTFQSRVQSEELGQEIEAATAENYSYGITGTPFFMINDAVISGAYPLDFIQKTVETQADLVAGRN